MNSKVAVLLVSVPLVCGFATVAGVYLIKPELLSPLPIFAEVKSAGDDGQKPGGKEPQNVVDAGAVQHKESIAQEQPAAFKQISTGSTAVTPASDFVAPVSRTSPASRAMREISVLQSRMAQGVDASPPELKSAMRRAEKIFVPRDTTAASLDDIESTAQYVLSGGDPAAAEKALQNSKLNAQQRDLIEGVLGYATADLTKAKEKLLRLDAKRYGVMLDAHLTMVQVQLDEHSDFHKSLKRLAYVANTVPGTLIEEASIRRMIPLFDGVEDPETFLYWTKRYFRRFPNSLYYEDFEWNVIDRLLKASAVSGRAIQSVLAEIFESSQPAQAASLTRQMMIAAVDTGNSALCDDIHKSLLSTVDLEAEPFADTRVLLVVCKASEADDKRLEDLRLMDGLTVSEATKIRLGKAIVMAEAINNNSPLQDDGHFGPHLPLSQSGDYASLFASVAQQIDTSLSAMKKAEDHETRLNN